MDKFIIPESPLSPGRPGGLRYNTGKPKWSLLDMNALEPVVRVMEYGAKKYAPHDWKKGMPHTEIADCLQRHLFAYLNGEDNDPESKLPHMAHVMTNAMMLMYNIQHHPGLDDRYRQFVADKAGETLPDIPNPCYFPNEQIDWNNRYLEFFRGLKESSVPEKPFFLITLWLKLKQWINR